MLTEEQEKALLEEIEKLRQDKAALISRVSSLEQSLYWLRKKGGCKLNCVSKVNILFYSLLTQFNLHPLCMHSTDVSG